VTPGVTAFRMAVSEKPGSTTHALGASRLGEWGYGRLPISPQLAPRTTLPSRSKAVAVKEFDGDLDSTRLTLKPIGSNNTEPTG
jgi:hypothetical protein